MATISSVMPLAAAAALFLFASPGSAIIGAEAFSPPSPLLLRPQRSATTGANGEDDAMDKRAWIRASSGPLFSSFASDSSDYSSKGDKSAFGDDSDNLLNSQYGRPSGGEDPMEEDDPETIELKPVPRSKNSGNKFVAVVWDQEVDIHGRDPLQLHNDRDELIEDHVMFLRKRNLYNETFNTDSMVDIHKSYQLLSSDLQRVVGHTLIMETTKLEYVHELLKEEPIGTSLTGGDISNIQLYRWRHIRDFTLRWDDGRFGFPCMLVAMDYEPEVVGNQLRAEHQKEMLEYLIRSERIISAGPLHLPTEFKDDPSSIAVGDMIMFNAKNRDEAIDFVEEMPYAKAGLYKEMRVLFYNNLDITGKFVLVDELKHNPCEDMKEAMEYWGYPVDDMQTPWLNW